MSKCEKCKEKVNLLNAYVYFGPGWIRWECPKCNYTRNYERTGIEPIDHLPYQKNLIKYDISK